MGFYLEVSGNYACFTRPEMKVERVSYDVITPSSARAIFESILWKPAIAWHIHKIEVLKPIKWVSIRRNEVGAVLPVGNINKAIKGGELPALYIEDTRQQRAGLFLKDVAYRLYASFSLTDKAQAADNSAKFAEMFKRRARKGQCFNQPYLGCREFSCDFKLIEDLKKLTPAIETTQALGWMLYDMDYQIGKEPMPLFYNAVMTKGIINVPDRSSEDVRG